MEIFGKRQTAREKEWDELRRREERFARRQRDRKPSGWNQKLEQYVPAKLQGTLNAAFYKAFQMIFQKGTKVIEKTYRREERELQFQVDRYAADLKETKKSLGKFNKRAGRTQQTNVLLSGAEGVGLGLLGIGIPDIPVFTGMLLKSIYEIALSYGYSYEKEEEQIFILSLIETSLRAGEEFVRLNERIDQWIAGNGNGKIGEEEQIRKTAAALSGELLYMKFLQGIPVAGVIGGIADAVYLKQITDYAAVKYRRRFLTDRERTQ